MFAGGLIQPELLAELEPLVPLAPLDDSHNLVTIRKPMTTAALKYRYAFAQARRRRGGA
ncbi:MAG: hypothetical protein J2P48_08585 [Alphaproteobacteria bacterium]|nr:hypothetical protein [Alphaproteobacteria bacterium]